MFLMGVLGLILIVVGVPFLILTRMGQTVDPLRQRIAWMLIAAGALILVLARLGLFPEN
jgi:hypothetical protein